jgi:hypothetical protein
MEHSDGAITLIFPFPVSVLSASRVAVVSIVLKIS